MNKKIIIAALIILILCFAGCQSAPEEPTSTPTAVVTSTPEPTSTEVPSLCALIIIGDQFGNTYFDMKTALEERGFWVTTVGIGEKELISSCPNHENIPVTPDMDITQISEININDYHLVFIPAGKHHRTIQYSDDVHRVLNLSKENGLYISSVCAGNIVLASADGLIEGHEIASSSHTRQYIESADGIAKSIAVAVDGQFVTASTGGGNSGTSHTGAPIDKLADALAELLNDN